MADWTDLTRRERIALWQALSGDAAQGGELLARLEVA